MLYNCKQRLTAFNGHGIVMTTNQLKPIILGSRLAMCIKRNIFDKKCVPEKGFFLLENYT